MKLKKARALLSEQQPSPLSHHGVLVGRGEGSGGVRGGIALLRARLLDPHLQKDELQDPRRFDQKVGPEPFSPLPRRCSSLTLSRPPPLPLTPSHRAPRRRTGNKLEVMKAERAGLSSKSKSQKKKEERMEQLLKENSFELQKLKMSATIFVSVARERGLVSFPSPRAVGR